MGGAEWEKKNEAGLKQIAASGETCGLRLNRAINQPSDTNASVRERERGKSEVRQQLHNITCIKYLAPPSYGLGSFYELARLDFDLGVVSIAPHKNSTGEHFNNITLYIYK